MCVVATACGRISFDPLGDPPPVDGVIEDAPAKDADIDAIVRACLTSPAYTTMGTSRYREGFAIVSWSSARADCIADGADLWVPNNATEQNAWTGDWIGITDAATEGTWLTVAGTPATFLPWAVLQPDGGIGENCGRTSNMGFEDRDCNDGRTYVCECPF